MMKYIWQAAKVLLCESGELLHNTGTRSNKGPFVCVRWSGTAVIMTPPPAKKKQEEKKTMEGLTSPLSIGRLLSFTPILL